MTHTPTEGFTERLAHRCRLIEQEGAAGPVQFWRGVDTVARPVAVTLIIPGDDLRPDQVDEVIDRTARLSGLEMSGLARILDGFKVDGIGVVLSEWMPGGTLREVCDTAPSPVGAAAALKSLVVTADAAHRVGLVLGVDHPDRVRISSDGRAVLAFPAPLPATTRGDDLRGIGGVFYALLVDRWPPQDPMPGGWVAADVEEAGWPREPAAIKPGIPFLISSAAAGLLRPGSDVSDTSILLALLGKAAPGGRVRAANRAAPVPPPSPGSYAVFRARDPVATAKQAKRHLTYTVLAIAAAIMFVLITGLGSSVSKVLDAYDDNVAMDPAQLGLNPGQDNATGPESPSTVLKQGAVDTAVAPVRASVFSPDGRPDNPGDAGKVIDGDPVSAWTTDRYYDANPFPVFKQGLGLLITLPEPTKIGAVSIETRSAGTSVQIRGATGDNPKQLADTTELSPPTPLQPGVNRISLPAAKESSTVIVWITTLGSTDGGHRAEIAEIKVNAPALA